MNAQTRPRVRRTPAPWWFAALIGIPLLFGVGGAQASKSAIEQDLTQRAEQVLQGVGASDASVDFDGRDAVVEAGTVDADQVREALSRLPGVRSVKVAP